MNAPGTAIRFAVFLWASALVAEALAAPIDPYTSASTQICYQGVSPCVSLIGHSGEGPFSFNGAPSSSSLALSDINVPVHPELSLIGEASMVIDPGFFSAYANANGHITASTGQFGYNATATGNALDSLTIATGAILDLPVHLSGGVSIEYSKIGSYIYPPGTNPFAAVSLSLNCRVSDVGSNLPAKDCSQTFLFTNSAAVDSIVHFHIPFTAGIPFYLAMNPVLTASIGLPAIPIADYDAGKTAVLDGHAIGDFSHTGVYQGATVLDANGSPVSNVVIQSASGFDYVTGYAVVPAPPAVWLLGTGCLGLLGWTWRKQPRSEWRRQL